MAGPPSPSQAELVALSLSPPPLMMVAYLFSPTPKLSLLSSKPPWPDTPSPSQAGLIAFSVATTTHGGGLLVFSNP